MTNTNTVKILMVDDHPENLLALEAVLMSENYHLIKAHSGEEALKWVLKEDFAVILLDVQMPGLNGFETAQIIKERERSKHIPIIFITAISQAKEHVYRGYSVGAIDYIFKPFHPETLKMKIEAFVMIHEYHEKIKQQSELLRQRTYELRKTEALARMIGETSVDTIVTLDASGTVLAVNPAVTNMFGYDVDAVVGQHVSLLLPEYDLPEIGKVIEMIAVRQDRREFPVDIQVGSSNIEGQDLFVCSMRDITERKAHYNTLEERFYKIFESSPSMIAIRSLADGRYLDVNESWLAHTGYQPYEVINKTLCVVGEVSEGGLRNQKIRYQTKSGEMREGLLSTETILIEGEVCQLNVVTDITERSMLEREMARLDRLNLVGEMAAGIAHEIRNPMTTVRGFLQLTKGQPNAPTHEYINLMVHELDRANAIITEFLTLAKNKTADKQRTCLNETIRALYPLIQAEALLSAKDVQLELGDCPALYLDEKEIRQMILNLALNGLEAMSDSGKLTIRTTLDEEAVMLEVCDQGSGIKPELLEKIGTPFFTTKEQGTGLGLAVCYSVASRHNAVIDIKSGESGTTFVIRFELQHENTSQ